MPAVRMNPSELGAYQAGRSFFGPDVTVVAFQAEADRQPFKLKAYWKLGFHDARRDADKA